MTKMFVFRKPVFLDVPDDGGSGDGEPAAELQSVADVPRPDFGAGGEAPPAEGETPPAEGGEATPPAAPEPSDDPFSLYGGKDNVEAALSIAQGFTNEQGLKAIFTEVASALGVDEATARALLSGQAPATPTAPSGEGAPAEEMSDEDILTWGEAKAKIDERVEAALAERVKPLEERQQSAQQSQAASATNSTLRELGLDTSDPEQAALAQQVLVAASAHLAEDDWDPEHIAAAIRQGHADQVAYIEKAAKRYLQEKKGDSESVPQPLGGGASGGEPVEEPKDLQEAMRRVRASGLFG